MMLPANDSRRCQEHMVFMEMDLQCQKRTHRIGPHIVEWMGPEGRHLVEWYPGWAERLKGSE